MLSEVIEFNNRYRLLDGCGSVIVGLSGGADSVGTFSCAEGASQPLWF